MELTAERFRIPNYLAQSLVDGGEVQCVCIVGLQQLFHIEIHAHAAAVQLLEHRIRVCNDPGRQTNEGWSVGEEEVGDSACVGAGEEDRRQGVVCKKNGCFRMKLGTSFAAQQLQLTVQAIQNGLVPLCLDGLRTQIHSQERCHFADRLIFLQEARDVRQQVVLPARKAAFSEPPLQANS